LRGRVYALSHSARGDTSCCLSIRRSMGLLAVALEQLALLAVALLASQQAQHCAGAKNATMISAQIASRRRLSGRQQELEGAPQLDR
jgi:hypothetical protein